MNTAIVRFDNTHDTIERSAIARHLRNTMDIASLTKRERESMFHKAFMYASDAKQMGLFNEAFITAQLLNNTDKVSAADFFNRLAQEHFHEIFGFVEFLFKITDPTLSRQHVVHHSLLVDYGIVQRLKLHELAEFCIDTYGIDDTDFIEEWNGGHQAYWFRPAAFKLMLIRAPPEATNHATNPRTYATYLIAIESVRSMYIDYCMRYYEYSINKRDKEIEQLKATTLPPRRYATKSRIKLDK